MLHKKKVKIFRQNDSMETCVCCCILMILDYYFKLPHGMNHPTRQYEKNLYSLLGYHLNGVEYDNYPIKFTRGTPLSAAAYYLTQRGLNASIYHADGNYMDNLHRGEPYYPKNVFPAIMEKYRSWMEKSCKRLTYAKCEKLSTSVLTDIIDGGKLILAMCFMDSADGDILHGIILDRYQIIDGKIVFHVCNPATGNHILEEDVLLRRMDTPVGIHFLTV